MLVLTKNESKAKFDLGNVVSTSGVYEMVDKDIKFHQFVAKSFKRHCNGDWGDLDKEDKMANDFALCNGDDRLFSKYNYKDGISIYIITEWDRSYTTILFPSEY